MMLFRVLIGVSLAIQPVWMTLMACGNFAADEPVSSPARSVCRCCMADDAPAPRACPVTCCCFVEGAPIGDPAPKAPAAPQRIQLEPLALSAVSLALNSDTALASNAFDTPGESSPIQAHGPAHQARLCVWIA